MFKSGVGGLILQLAEWFFEELFVAQFAQVFHIPQLVGKVRIVGWIGLCAVFFPRTVGDLGRFDETPMDFVAGF